MAGAGASQDWRCAPGASDGAMVEAGRFARKIRERPVTHRSQSTASPRLADKVNVCSQDANDLCVGKDRIFNNGRTEIVSKVVNLVAPKYNDV